MTPGRRVRRLSPVSRNERVYKSSGAILTLDTDIVDAFKGSLKHISWMDKESATAAAEKVRIYISYIGIYSLGSVGGCYPRQSWLPSFT